MKRLNDDNEGEELQDILLIKDLDGEKNTGIINERKKMTRLILLLHI